jgi:tRNA(Ile)-lysidine synthase
LSYNDFAMLSTIQLILQHNCHIGINKPVVIGVSGGPDSLCLLDLLDRLGYPLIVAHMNHWLRGEADEEARLVERETNSRNLPFVTQTFNVRAFAKKSKRTLEEAARTARYNFLFLQARQYGAQAVAVGHTADDQVETVLMHLLRGAGLAGLTGMDYSTVIDEFDESIPLVRPLLGFWREEISAYITERGLVPAFDESNWDIRHHRNRLRHELIPLLEGYNPQIRRTIYRMANILRGDQEIIENVIDSALETCLMTQDREYVEFSANKLVSQPVGVQRRLLRRGIDLLHPGLRDIDYKSVDRGLTVLHTEGVSEIELLEGLYAILEEDRLIIASSKEELPAGIWPQVPKGIEYRLDIPGECRLPNDWRLRSVIVDERSGIWQIASRNSDPFQAWMNAEQITTPIIVRGRRPGDRFCPLGMDGHSVKLSDFMINNKIPARARAGWPLLFSNSEIIWIPGYRQVHHTRL